MKTFYWRVTVRTASGKTRSFWAKKRECTKHGITIYIVTDNEGNEKSVWFDKKGRLHIHKVGFDNRLIVKEQPAVEDRKYGTLKVVK